MCTAHLGKSLGASGTELYPILRLQVHKSIMRPLINPDGSLLNVIWKYCQRATFVDVKMETASALALCQFSMGFSFHQILSKCIEVEHSISIKCTSAEKDLLRFKAAQKLK